VTGVRARGADEGPLPIEQAVELAVSRNERARISDYGVVAASAAVEKARTAFFPIAQAVGSDQQHAYGATDRLPNNVRQFSVTLSQPILNASAFPLYAQSEALLDAQRAQNVDDKRVLGFNAASAFLAVLTAGDVLRAAERQFTNAQANLADAQGRVDAGLTSSNDVTRAQVDLAGAAREVELDKGAFENTVVQLAFVMNMPVSSSLAPPTATLAAAERTLDPVDRLVRFALDRRPDLIVARHSARAAHRFADEPLLRLVPTVGLQGQEATTSNSAGTGHWHDEIVTGTVTWTLYDSGARYADKHARDAQATIADLNMQQLERNVDSQVRSAVALLVSAQAGYHAADEAATAARKNAEESAILYRQGLAKAIELIDANDSRFAAEVSDTNAQYAMAQAYLNLRQAMGLDALGTELR
jgi:outer membrane protein TolC